MNLEWQLAVKECIRKLCQRSPLKYKLTRAISSFSRILIGTVHSTIIENRFGTLLEILSINLILSIGWVSTVTAENTTK